MAKNSAPNGISRFRSLNKAWLVLPVIVVFAAAFLLVGASTFRQMPVKSATLIPRQTPLVTSSTASEAMARGDADFDRGDFGQAIANYSRAIELRPEFAEAYNNRAYAYMTIQDYADAIPDLNAAIRIRPDYVNALMNRGDIYNFYHEIDYARAITDYDHVLAVDPEAASHTSLCGHRAIA